MFNLKLVIEINECNFKLKKIYIPIFFVGSNKIIQFNLFFFTHIYCDNN